MEAKWTMIFYFRLLENFFVELAKFVMFLANILPESLAFRICDYLGLMSWYLAPDSRGVALKNLDIIAPEMDKLQKKKCTIELFSHQYKNLVELLRYRKLTKELILRKKLRIKNQVYLERALRKKKGVILLIPHMGNWEFLGATLALTGYDINSFFLDLRFKKLSDMLNFQRRSVGITLIGRNELKKSIKVLKRNGLLGVIADQDGGEGGISTIFFGKRVSVPAGPLRLQRVTGAEIVPVVMLRNSDNTYTITASLGSIVSNGSSFKYTAPDVTDGDDDSDTITVKVDRINESQTQSDVSAV
jgi:KDO2-lipid IV(A) lauroyltransferase